MDWHRKVDPVNPSRAAKGSLGWTNGAKGI